uniref:Lymphocyte antigen 75 isoform X1 n=2 Tax=Geotrypetes seraphini TaxID=260995 RepID=A0A6P8QX99_GEOSA|nr:lymphocyte antigen 75 isoform X1 [Geotrypetes seraphini]
MVLKRPAQKRRWSSVISRIVLAVCVLAVSSTCTGYNEFTIRHENTSFCLKAQESKIVLAECGEHTDILLLWKWLSKHRLYNLGSQQCLGLDITKPTNSLGMFPCDSSVMLWWRCHDASVYGASQYRLSLKNGTVNIGMASNDTWRKGDSQENICRHPYHDIYTRDGNAHGKPCEFPFQYKGKLFHDCTIDERSESGWCATTFDYDSDGKWGVCLKSVNGCDHHWEQHSGLQSCYQFNFQSVLSWKEAYISCQNQGGDLLSIANEEELDYIQAKEDIPDKVWLGLNRLDTSGGWQWSDNTPLNFLTWRQDLSSASIIDGFSCGLLNADLGGLQQYLCESAFPYICKKQPNNTKSELPDLWSYSVTECDTDWVPSNKFCYMLVNDQYSWQEASLSCKNKSGDLISIHSLADIELILTKLHNETGDEIWSGFSNENTPAFFNWSDGSTVDFTYWDQNEPNVPYNSTPNCVSFSGKSGRWKIKPCDEKLKYICKKKGVFQNETQSDEGCPQKEIWKRHGNFCYKVDLNEASFGSQCNLTVMNRFEQEFINGLIRKASNAEGKYYWIGLQDVNSTGEYTWVNTGETYENVTYMNWNYLEPAFPGGCVAMASGNFLGKWEVKNCKSFKAFTIHKISIGSVQKEAPSPKPKYLCEEGWLPGSDGLYCYKVFHYERLLRNRTWEQAERFCEALGAHLPSFTSSTEMEMIYSLLRGLISGHRWIWIGLNKRNPASQGSWQWSDNRPVSTAIVPNDFYEDDYDLRDCAALRTKPPIWKRYSMFLFHNDREPEFYLKPFHCDATLEWICQIPSGTTLKKPDWYLPDGVGIHGSPFIIEGEEFWFVSSKNMTYEEAALYCANNGSKLASVESFTVLQAIKTKLQNIAAGQKWWIKSYVDNRRYSFPFQLERFYGPYSGDCWGLHISLSNTYTGFFSPMNCNQKLPFVCEKHNVSLLEKHTGEPKPSTGGCLKDWLPFGDKCFVQIKPKYLKFAKANEVCETYGGTLPSISSQIEQDFITSLLPKMPLKMWLGLQFSLTTREHKWVDDSNLSYSNFNPLLHGRLRKIPHDSFDEENNKQCMLILNDPTSPFIGTWDFTSCADEQYVGICQKFQDNTTKQDSPEIETYQNYHYKIIQSNLTWYDALSECVKNEMHLVSITNQYHQAFLSVKVNKLLSPMWIGLSSQDDGIHYEWSDGKHVSLSRWSEDDKRPAGDCVFLDTDGFWKTSDCDTTQQGAICYTSGNETNTKQKAEDISSVKCPHKVQDTPWISFKNNCYTFLISHKRWRSVLPDESHHVCRKLNSDAYVLSIRNEEENRFVVKQLKPFGSLVKWVWLGVIYNSVENYLQWHDKTFLLYSNWRFGRPLVKNNSFYAGVSLDGSWDLLSSDQTEYFKQHSIVACKIEKAPKEDYSTPPTKDIPFGKNNYSIITNKVTWHEAVRECKQKRGHLASMHDEMQQIFLEELVKRDGFPLWLGLSSHDGNESVFEWSDGSALDYTPWEFTMTNTTGNCIYLDNKGHLNRKNCMDVLDGAVCYVSTKSFTEEKSLQTESSSRCPQSSDNGQWIRYKNHCYGFDAHLYNFSVFSIEEANKICQELDSSSTLLTIKDEEENAFISKHIRDHVIITARVWLGFSYGSTSPPLKWVDGSVVDYANWETGVPDTNSTCGVILSTNGMWKKVNCKGPQSRIVCKTSLGTNHTGVAIAFAVIIILALIAGLVVYLYKKKKAVLFSPVRYQRSLDEAESMFISDVN